MKRVVPGALTLSIGGDSKLLAFSGKDLQLIKEVSVASATPDQFSLTLGPASSDGADRQLLVKANAGAAPGIYRLRLLFTTRGGVLLDPRMIKLRVMPGEAGNKLADKKASRPERQSPGRASDMKEPDVIPTERAAQSATIALNDDIPPEPEVVGGGPSVVSKKPRTMPRDDGRQKEPVNDRLKDVPLRATTPGAAEPAEAPVLVSGRLPESRLSRAMLAEAMGELSGNEASARDMLVVLRDNVMPAKASRSTWLKLARGEGDTPRLALLAPGAQKSFMRGYFAQTQNAGAQLRAEAQLPAKSNTGVAVGRNDAVLAPSGEDPSPEYLATELPPVVIRPPARIVAPLRTPAPPVLLPRVKTAPVIDSTPADGQKQPVDQLALNTLPVTKESDVIEPEVLSTAGSEPKVASVPGRKPTAATPSGKTVATTTGATVGMRALPVYWIRGMAPTAMLVGSVRNAQTGEPVEGAELLLGSSIAKTSAAGLYSLPSEDDSRQLKITANGYLPLQLTAPRQSGAQMDEVDISLIPVKPAERDKNLPDLMVVSPPTSPLCRGDKQTVRVRIFNAGRKPVKNYDVSMFSRQWREGSSQEGINDDPISIDGPPLRAGETRVVDVPVMIAADSLWAEMTAEVDAKSRHDELLETNNRSNPRRIVVASLPDCDQAVAKLPDYAMLPSLSIVEADGEQGCQLETAVTLANYSNEVAPPVEVTLSMNSAGDLIFSKSLRLEALQPTEQQALRFASPVDVLLAALSRSLSLPSLLPDQRMTLSVEVNAELEQEERFTTNNRVEFSGRLSEFVASENLLYRKRGEACLTSL